MFKLNLAFSFADIFCECSPIRNDLLSKRSDSCRELCSFPLSEMASGDVGALTNHSNEEEHAKFCQQFQILESCFKNRKSQCYYGRILKPLNNKIAIATIVCTPQLKNAIIPRPRSKCATDNAKRQEAERLVEQCLHTFWTKAREAVYSIMNAGHSQFTYNYCPDVNELKFCAIARVFEICGYENSRFYLRFWDTKIEPKLTYLGC